MSHEFFAFVFLLALALIPVVCAAISLARDPYTPAQILLWYAAFVLVRFRWRAELPRKLPVPEETGAVIISNHRSTIDPFYFQVAARRRKIYWMVAQLHDERSPIGWFLRVCETIPIRRRGSSASPTKTAIRLAANGGVIGVFPEGTVNTTDRLMREVRPGAVMIALKARVPILPCYIEGSPYNGVAWGPILMTAHVRMKVGRLIDLSEYYGREREDGVLQKLAVRCVKEIADLAGQPDFEPRLAGRNWKAWE